MKKNGWMKFALITLSALTCVSGQVARPENRETAMTKCTRAPDSLADEPGGKSNSKEAVSKAEPKKLKSAAQKSIELELYGTSSNTEVRKGAAKQAMEEIAD